MAVSAGRFRKFFDRIAGFVEMRVSERGDQTVRPVQIVGRDFRRGVAQVGGRIVDVRIERRGRGEGAGTVRNPHDRTACLRRVRADLHGHHMPGAVDADRTVAMAAFRRSERAVRVVRGSLEVCAHQEVDVFERHSALRHATPRNIVGRGRVAGGRRIPILAWIEVALHVPGTRSVVDAVFGGGGAESRARIEMAVAQRRAATAIAATVHADVSESTRRLESEAATCSRAHSAVKVMRIHEFAQIGTAHEFTLGVEGVVEVEIVDAELVGDGRIAVVRHAAGDPMVPADRFDIPDFVYVGNDDAVRFVGAVCFKQFGETCDAFACRGDVRQHEGDDVFFSDSARDFGGISGFVRRLQFNERISG